MTVEYIRYKIQIDQREAFIGAYKSASEELDSSEFCIGYELTECEEEAGQFILRIEWTSPNDHLNGFRKSALFPTFLGKIKPYYSNILEMRHYTLTDVISKS